MNLKLLIILLTFLIVALVGTLAWYLRGGAVSPVPDEAGAPEESQEPGFESSSSSSPVLEGGEGGNAVSSPREVKVSNPTIPTTPFTVYLGFATAVGTSSAEVMGQEVSEVVVGYEWEALPLSPPFSRITLPRWDPSSPEKTYPVYIWEEGTYISFGVHVSGQEISFPRQELRGETRFKVEGIDPELRICPGDRSFDWNARFTISGRLGLVRTPITKPLPAGETCRMQ